MNNWPVVYSCRLMEPGIISYQDSGDGIAYVPKETIDRIVPSIIGKPVVIKHQNVTPANAHEHAVGHVIGAHYNPSDAWHYVDFLITSDKIEAIEKEDGSTAFKDTKGNMLDGVSGAYDVLNASGGGVWHDIKFDHKIIDGSFTHLALVNNPRYEETNRIVERMPSMLVNGKVATMKNSLDYGSALMERLDALPIGYSKEINGCRVFKNTNTQFTVNGQRVGREEAFEILLNHYDRNTNSKDNATITTPDLGSVDPNSLDPIEKGMFDRAIKQGMSKEQAMQILVNMVEGDWTQLSSQLAQRARRDKTFNAKNETSQAAFEKEKKEHPEFTDEQIWKIVRDHEEKKNAVTFPNGRAGVFKKGEVVRDINGVYCKIVGEAQSGEYYVVQYPDGSTDRMREVDINSNSKTEYQYKQNSKEAQMNLFKIFKKLVNGEEEVTDLAVDIDGKPVAVNDLIEAYKTDEAEEAKKKADNEKRLQAEKEAEDKRKKDEEEKAKENARKNLRMAKDEDTVEIDGKKVTIGELKNRYAKKNAKNETAEEKAAREKKEKEDAEKAENAKNGISKDEAEDLFEQYAKEKGGSEADFYDNPEDLTPQAISSWLKSKGKGQADVNYVIGQWKSMLMGAKNEKDKKEAEEKENAKKTAQAKNIELWNSKKAAGEIFMATNAKLTPGDPVQLGAGHYTVTELGENPIGTAGVWLKENAKKGEEFFTRIENAGNDPQKPALDAPVGRQERAARSTSKHSSKKD